jgi:hypothetical protein
MNRYEILLGHAPVQPVQKIRVEPGQSISFTIPPDMTEKFVSWERKHRCSHESGQVRFTFRFRFTPTNIGTLVQVHCLCGKSVYLGETRNPQSYPNITEACQSIKTPSVADKHTIRTGYLKNSDVAPIDKSEIIIERSHKRMKLIIGEKS